MSVSLLRPTNLKLAFPPACLLCARHFHASLVSLGVLAQSKQSPERPVHNEVPQFAAQCSNFSQAQANTYTVDEVENKSPVDPHARRDSINPRMLKKLVGDGMSSGPSRNPLEPNKVDLYLASLRAAGLEPTLVDIERCRPHRHSHPSSPEYAEDYRNLVDTLCRSFSKEQLRHFGELYDLDPIWTRSSRRKVEYAETIIEKQWNWPSLKEIERQTRGRTEVHVKCA